MTQTIVAPETIVDEAHRAAIDVVMHPEVYERCRREGGDCFAGALAAGASIETALEVSQCIHTTPNLRDRLPSAGGLLVGAQEFLKRGIDG